MKQKKTTPFEEENETFLQLDGFPPQEELDDDLEYLDHVLEETYSLEDLEDEDLPQLPTEAPQQRQIIRQHVAPPPQLAGQAPVEEEDEAAFSQTAAETKMVGWVFRKVQGQSEVTVVTSTEEGGQTEAVSAPLPPPAEQEEEPVQEEEEAPPPQEDTPAQEEREAAPPAQEQAPPEAPAAGRRSRPISRSTPPAPPKAAPVTPISQAIPESEPAAPSTGKKKSPRKKRSFHPFAKVMDKANRYSDNLFVGDDILQGTDLSEEEERAARQEELRRRGFSDRPAPLVEESEYVEVDDSDQWDTEEPEEPAGKKKRRREKARIPLPDLSPRTLATLYGDGLNKQRFNTLLCFVLCVPLLYANLADSLNLPIFHFLWDDKWCAALMLEGLSLVSLLLRNTLWRGLGDLFHKKVGLHTLTSIGVLLTLADCAWFAILGREGPLPCGGIAALCLTCTSWGCYLKNRAQRLSCRAAAATESPTRLVMERDEDGDPTRVLLASPGTPAQFGSQIQEPDGVEQLCSPIALVLLIGGVVFTLLASLGSQSPERILWCGSIIFVMSSPLSATMAYSLPYYRIAKRLHQSGAALAGWDGVRELGRCNRMVVSDDDLFPTGRISCHGLHLYGKVSADLVSGYAASLVRVSGSGLSRAFNELAASQQAMDWDVGDFQLYPGGGCSGVIRNDQVILGSAAFMKLMEIPMPEESSVKTAVFCAINGQLAGQIVLNYKLPTYVNPAMNAILHNRITPLMCLRDFVLTPELLQQKFAMKLDKAEFPAMDDRILLTDPELAEGGRLAALLNREGLAVHGDTLIGGQRLYRAARRNGWFTVIASVLGMLLGFYLSFMGAYTSLQPLNLLLFLLLWMVPIVLISRYVDQF